MPRRRQSVAAQDPMQVLLEEISSLQKIVRNLTAAKMSSVQVIDIANFNDPAEGMACIDWPTSRYCFYHDNQWFCVPTLPVHAIKVYGDSKLNKTGDGVFRFSIEDDLAGKDIVLVRPFTGTSGTGSTTLQISKHVGDNASGTDLLVSPATIASGDTFGSLASISAVEVGGVPIRRMALGDSIWIDVDAVGTGSKGLGIYITFATPEHVA